MKMTIDAGMMKEMFVNYDRDYYSFSGLETLLDYYDEINPEMEFDPIAICCDCTEYGENSVCSSVCSFNDLISDYGYLYPVKEWLEDNLLEENEFNKELYINSLVERLEEETTVLHVPNGNYIVFAF